MRWDKNIRVPTRSETSGCSLSCARMVPGIDSTYSLSLILNLGLVVPDFLNLREYIGKKPDVRTWMFYCPPGAVERFEAEKLCFVAVLGEMNVVGKRQRIVKLKTFRWRT